MLALATAAVMGVGLTGCDGSAAANPTTAATPTATHTPTFSPAVTPTLTPTSARTPTPAPLVLARGDRGVKVRELQARLRRAKVYALRVSGVYGAATERAVAAFQRAHDLPATGSVDVRTWALLRRLTPQPTRAELYPPAATGSARLDPRCRTGRVICISKSARRLYWVVDGEIRMSMSVRFGSAYQPTRNGEFRVYRKSRDHVSSLYHTPMPYAMFFSGGQAIHYSAGFARQGYAGTSHGCVNTRDRGKTAALFDTVRIGDKVVIYR
ncbi:ErfK/YbiS/YcfS/YnhG family protein [Carbonactinospora thermoautotrophica]|uniref:ErfK/YbiS/YcfS/YnhG family protein n=1 Tax=Carbonactinospora thermoautotrophica TaxID=1469144 RepID=A0A132MWG9_9ACTN|nr:ErfK/YbiS/YcfS/YnhG family protein [Carbonactinospora thermoautotrophica]